MIEGYFLLFFDLPALEENYGKEYRKLIVLLKQKGFIRIQKSVFGRIRTAHEDSQVFGKSLKKNFGSKFGNIALLSVTKNEFEAMYMVSGQPPAFSTESVVFL